jgi:protein SCO1/2
MKHAIRPIVMGGLLMLFLLASCQPYQFKGTSYEDPPDAADFELTRADGGRLRLSDLKGKIVLLFFGFATCPDVCPVTLSDAKRIIENLGDKSVNLSYLFITVDPERDTPEKLKTYVSNFHENIIGLTGTEEELAAVREDYGIYAAKVPLKSGIGYTMDHTARVYLIDNEGRLRLTYAFGTPYEDILQDIKQILKEIDSQK